MGLRTEKEANDTLNYLDNFHIDNPYLDEMEESIANQSELILIMNNH